MKNILVGFGIFVIFYLVGCAAPNNSGTGSASLAFTPNCPDGTEIRGSRCVVVASSDFSYLIASDPQFYWAQFDGNEINAAMSEEEKQASSRMVNQWQSSAIRDNASTGLPPAELLIMNGDMTAFGRTFEWNEVNNYYDTDKIGIPLYWGLGNHDYQNNVGDCYEVWGTFFDGTEKMGCAWHMVDRMDGFIRDTGLDKQGRGGDEVGYDADGGSRSYYWARRNYVFFQLHNFPGYVPNMSVSRLGKTAPGSVIPWLTERVAYFSSKGKKIVLNYHIPYQSELIKAIDGKNVVAIFNGHFHGSYGIDGTITLSNRIVPIFLSGSAMWNKYLHVTFGEDKFIVSIIDSTNGKATKQESLVYSTVTGEPY